MAAVQTQPSTVKPTFKSILALPSRLCNPPPAVGKVRSFGVTPLFNVRLEDVLDRKHLPPLGLKDFEEWLLYVEMCPENLYFILWLHEYRCRYAEWQKQRNSPKDAVGASNAASRLAMFYSRAKHTFFTPDAQYELNLPSVILAPFHKPDQDPYPDPSLFGPVEAETKRMLEQSLRRFIHGQMNNVGNSRVLCGIVAGIFIMIVGFLPPIVTNFVVNGSRWLRLTAFPGTWLGLTILLCALHGVCLGVYIFGDLRQLRKFELARPPISKQARQSDSRPRVPPHPVVLPPSPPMPAYTRPRRYSQAHTDHHASSSAASVSEYSDISCAAYPRGAQSIQLTPIYIETNPIEGPSTCPILVEYCNPQNDAEWLRRQELQKELEKQMELDKEPNSPDSFTSTATFIGPFRSPSVTDMSGYWDNEEILSLTARWYRKRAMEDLEKLGNEAVKRQPLSEFDFDGLPPPPVKFRGSAAANRDMTTRSVWDDEARGRWQWFLDFVDRVQTRCSFKKWGPTPGSPSSGPMFLGGVPPYLSSRPHSKKSRSRINLTATSKSTLSISTCSTAHEDAETAERVKKRGRFVKAVPAFAVPLTKVLNPIIVRGQWQIVVRSAGLAFLITWVVCGSLLAIPVR